MTTFKIALFGEAASGKTAYLRSLRKEVPEKTYIPTLGVDLRPFTLETSQGPVTYQVWDCAGQERFAGLGEGYFIGADAGVSFASSDPTRTAGWERDFHQMCRKSPIVRVWGKSDAQPPPDYLEGQVIVHSTKEKIHYWDPLLEVTRTLLQDPDLRFLHDTPKVPEVMAKY